MTPLTPEMIERAARSDAAFDGRDFDRLGRIDRQRYLDRAQKALTAALSCPDGFRLVPVEPTTGMISAGESAASVGIGKCNDDESLPRVWRAMLAASPVPSQDSPPPRSLSNKD